MRTTRVCSRVVVRCCCGYLRRCTNIVIRSFRSGDWRQQRRLLQLGAGATTLPACLLTACGPSNLAIMGDSTQRSDGPPYERIPQQREATGTCHLSCLQPPSQQQSRRGLPAPLQMAAAAPLQIRLAPPHRGLRPCRRPAALFQIVCPPTLPPAPRPAPANVRAAPAAEFRPVLLQPAAISAAARTLSFSRSDPAAGSGCGGGCSSARTASAAAVKTKDLRCVCRPAVRSESSSSLVLQTRSGNFSSSSVLSSAVLSDQVTPGRSDQAHVPTNPVIFSALALAVYEYRRLPSPCSRLLGNFCTLESQLQFQDPHAPTIQ
jgi:hypothetical protein